MESFKKEEKKATAAPVSKKKFIHLLDTEEVELKKLTDEDLEESVNVMKKCSFEVTPEEVKTIVDYQMSFGATVNRMIVGVGLAWAAHFDVDKKILTTDKPNCLYLEDPAVLLAYEGRGIRRILVKEREKEAKERGFKYVVAYLSEDLPKGNVAEYIVEGGTVLEKLYLTEEYEFLKTDRGILAFKKI
jgi:GNAT superfamily N-acetyltransferase